MQLHSKYSFFISFYIRHVCFDILCCGKVPLNSNADDDLERIQSYMSLWQTKANLSKLNPVYTIDDGYVLWFTKGKQSYIVGQEGKS